MMTNYKQPTGTPSLRWVPKMHPGVRKTHELCALKNEGANLEITMPTKYDDIGIVFPRNNQYHNRFLGHTYSRF